MIHTCALFRPDDQSLHLGNYFFSGDVISCMLEVRSVLYIGIESRVSM